MLGITNAILALFVVVFAHLHRSEPMEPVVVSIVALKAGFHTPNAKSLIQNRRIMEQSWTQRSLKSHPVAWPF